MIAIWSQISSVSNHQSNRIVLVVVVSRLICWNAAVKLFSVFADTNRISLVAWCLHNYRTRLANLYLYCTQHHSALLWRIKFTFVDLFIYLSGGLAIRRFVASRTRLNNNEHRHCADRYLADRLTDWQICIAPDKYHCYCPLVSDTTGLNLSAWMSDSFCNTIEIWNFWSLVSHGCCSVFIRLVSTKKRGSSAVDKIENVLNLVVLSFSFFMNVRMKRVLRMYYTYGE